MEVTQARDGVEELKGGNSKSSRAANSRGRDENLVVSYPPSVLLANFLVLLEGRSIGQIKGQDIPLVSR
jgi:hypothetical protein